jgi:hypothetical protein
LWGAPLGGEFFLWGIFILNEIWAQSKIYILLGTLLGGNMNHTLIYKLNVIEFNLKYAIH